MNAITFTNCLFEGIEAEGPYKGKKTLFVSCSNIEIDVFLKLCKKGNYQNIYFGAGNTYTISKKFLKILPKLIQQQILITIEIKTEQELQKIQLNVSSFYLKNILIVFFLDKNSDIAQYQKYQNFSKKINFLKIGFPDKVVWFPISKNSDIFTTYLDDKIFLHDRRINNE